MFYTRRFFHRCAGRAGLALLLGMMAFVLGTGCSTYGSDGSYGADDPAPIDARSNEIIITWSTIAHDAFIEHNDYLNGLNAVRVFAMLHLAQHDALNAIDPAYATYAFDGSDPDADPVVAAAAAAHAVMTATLPEQQSTFDAALNETLDAASDAEAASRGVTLGEQAAAAILALRADDGSDLPIVGDYSPGKGPGRYQFVPPYDFAFLPGWETVTPFTLDAAGQFRPGPPPALDSEAYAEAFNEVKAIGEADSPDRTADQTYAAKFWEEYADRGWNRVARIVAAEQDLGLQTTARLFALMNMAISDAYVAGWDGKFYYNFWRPYTAIRAAETDGNPATTADAEWATTIETPPAQDYPSTHSAVGNAAAAVLADVLGDATPFTFSSTSADPASPTRSFPSFSAAADENADSRVWGGIHFRFACDAGQALGDKVGAWTLANALQPQ